MSFGHTQEFCGKPIYISCLYLGLYFEFVSSLYMQVVTTDIETKKCDLERFPRYFGSSKQNLMHSNDKWSMQLPVTVAEGNTSLHKWYGTHRWPGQLVAEINFLEDATRNKAFGNPHLPIRNVFYFLVSQPCSFSSIKTCSFK